MSKLVPELSERIPEVREQIALMSLHYELPTRPSKIFRMAMRPTGKPYNHKLAKRRRKIAKASRRANRK